MTPLFIWDVPPGELFDVPRELLVAREDAKVVAAIELLLGRETLEAVTPTELLLGR